MIDSKDVITKMPIEDMFKKQTLFKDRNDYIRYRPDPQYNQFLEQLDNKEKRIVAKMKHDEHLKEIELDLERIRMETEMRHSKEMQGKKQELVSIKHGYRVDDMQDEILRLTMERNVEEVLRELKFQTGKEVGYLKVQKVMESVIQEKYKDYTRRGPSVPSSPKKDNLLEKIIKQVLV
jgi:hypothetical protein